MEEENRRARKHARRVFNDKVRELASFVRKRDKRVSFFQASPPSRCPWLACMHDSTLAGTRISHSSSAAMTIMKLRGSSLCGCRLSRRSASWRLRSGNSKGMAPLAAALLQHLLLLTRRQPRLYTTLDVNLVTPAARIHSMQPVPLQQTALQTPMFPSGLLKLDEWARVIALTGVTGMQT